MDLQDYKVKNTTKCECGHEFTIHDMKKLQRIPNNSFYGGVVKHIDEIKCPICSKDTLLLLKQVGQTYIVKDIAQKDTIITETEHTIEDDTIKYETAIESHTIENNEEIVSSKELICTVCEKSFKSKSGLSMHMKTHNNN